MSTMSTVASSPRKLAINPATDHRFYSSASILAAIVIFAGFANTYGPKVLGSAAAPPTIIHAHAVVFASWILLFVTQNLLVLNGRTDMHRKIGPWAMGLAAVVLVLGSATAITMTRAGHRGIPGVEFDDPGGFLLLNIAALVVFSVLVVAGWYYRQNPQAHKRLMFMATMATMVGPGASRLPFASGRPPVIAVIVVGFMLAGPIYDLITRRRIHPAYRWGLVLGVFAIPPVDALLSSTAAWHAIAAALLG
jgi:uncharacterized membrane protein YozB (DUF420 family)